MSNYPVSNRWRLRLSSNSAGKDRARLVRRYNSVFSWSDAVLRVEHAGVRFNEDSRCAFGLQLGSVWLGGNCVSHRNDHVQIGLHAHELNAEATEPRMTGLVIGHACIVLPRPRPARRRRPPQRVRHVPLRESWCPGRESNPHTFRSRILSPLRLPISSPGPGGCDDSQNFCRDVLQARALR